MALSAKGAIYKVENSSKKRFSTALLQVNALLKMMWVIWFSFNNLGMDMQRLLRKIFIKGVRERSALKVGLSQHFYKIIIMVSCLLVFQLEIIDRFSLSLFLPTWGDLFFLFGITAIGIIFYIDFQMIKSRMEMHMTMRQVLRYRRRCT